MQKGMLSKALPVHKKKSSPWRNTFQAVVKEWFDRFAATTTPRYAAEVWARLERDVFPFIGKMSLNDIDAPTVLAVLRRTAGRGVITTTYKIRMVAACLKATMGNTTKLSNLTRAKVF